MAYFKVFLSGIAAVIIAELVPGPWSAFRAINGSRSTGLGAFAGLLADSFLSPLFWMFALLLFAILFAVGRFLKKNALKKAS